MAHVVLAVKHIVVLILAMGHVARHDQLIIHDIDVGAVKAHAWHIHDQHNLFRRFIDIGRRHKPVAAAQLLMYAGIHFAFFRDRDLLFLCHALSLLLYHLPPP